MAPQQLSKEVPAIETFSGIEARTNIRLRQAQCHYQQLSGTMYASVVLYINRLLVK